jgi:hypothetical protein
MSSVITKALVQNQKSNYLVPVPVSGSISTAITTASAQKEATMRRKARQRQSIVTGSDTVNI